MYGPGTPLKTTIAKFYCAFDCKIRLLNALPEKHGSLVAVENVIKIVLFT